MRTSDVIKNMNIGVSKQTIEGQENSPLHVLMMGLHQEIIDRLNDSITKYDAVASNRLKQSLVTVDQSSSGVISVGVSADFYWKYVQYGTGPQHRPPANGLPETWGVKPAGTPTFKDAILGWIRDRGLKTKPGQTYDQMAFGIMMAIKRDGTKARPFFTDVVNAELKAYLTKSISEVYKEAIKIEIKEPWQ
jgi:hypothetical protein